MKKKNMGILFCIMFFSFSLIVEIYSLLEWRNDTVSIIGTSIVFLVSLYLLLDSLISEVHKFKEEISSIINNSLKDNNCLKDDHRNQQEIQLGDINLLLEQQTKEINKNVEDKINATKSELVQRQKNCVEVIIKAQRNFTEAIIKNSNK